MFRFILKKSFWNHVDGLLSAVLINIGYFALIAVHTLFVFFHSGNTRNVMIIISIFHILNSIYTFTVAHYIHDIAEGCPRDFKNFSKYLSKSWVTGILFALVTGLIFLFVLYSIPFYFKLGNALGAIAAALLSWVFIIAGLVFLYLPALSVRTKGGIKKSVVASFRMLIQHIPLTLGMLPVFLFQILFSFFTVFLIPGLAGILLRLEVSVQMAEVKNIYLAENPETNRKKIPWEEIFKKEDDAIGPRSLLETLFPFRRKE